MINKIQSKLRAEGLGGFLSAAYRRVLPYRPACYQLGKPYIEGKIGLEIGGPSRLFERRGSMPVYAVAARIDNCNFGHLTTWEGAIKEGATFHYDKQHAPGNQYVAEASDLSVIASSTYDFILSSHTLEHVANPLQALSEWIRALREEGLLVLIVPHRDGTFDRRRPVTTLAHLVHDFEQNTAEDDLTHLDEILRLHDLSRDPDGGDIASFGERSRRNLENRCLHQHVFDTRLAVDVVDHMRLQILAVDAFRPFHILVIARKPGRGQRVQNARFKELRAAPEWRSAFPSDHQPRHGRV